MMEKLQDFLLPIANKLSSNRYLSAIRDGYVAILPIMITGSMFTLINSVIIGENGLTNKWFGMPFEGLKDLGGAILPATMSVMCILLTFTTAKSLSEHYKEDTTVTLVIAVVCFFILMPIVNDKDLGIQYINTHYTGAASMFLSYIVAIVVVEILRKLTNIDALVIKMPEGVPTGIANSFNRIFPVMIIAILFGFIRLGTNKIGMPLNDILFNLIQIPFTKVVTSNFGIVIVYFVYMLLWGIGIHSSFIFSPILSPIYLNNLTLNEAALTAGQPMTEILTKPFVDSLAFMGGAGNMFALIVAILLFSKRKDYQSIAKIGIAPAFFNISEPIMFGLPVVMNPILILPMILSTIASLLIGILATTIGFMGHTYVLIPWTTPPILGAFLSTGGNWGAVLVTIIVFAVSVAIYSPFVIVMNRQAEEFEA